MAIKCVNVSMMILLTFSILLAASQANLSKYKACFDNVLRNNIDLEKRLMVRGRTVSFFLDFSNCEETLEVTEADPLRIVCSMNQHHEVKCHNVPTNGAAMLNFSCQVRIFAILPHFINL